MDGRSEDDVRLDQLLAPKGDELWYEYDFGDGWDHKSHGRGGARGAAIDGALRRWPDGLPPEDCGGIGGYEELAAWVRSGYDDAQLPAGFDNAAHAHDWLPLDWHPDRFDVDEANADLALAVAEPVAVTGELAELVRAARTPGHPPAAGVAWSSALSRPDRCHGCRAARLTETYRIFLDVIGDGVALTSAGYLPPAVVERFAERSGITGWWIGKANREDLTPPVAQVRDSAAAARQSGSGRRAQGALPPPPPPPLPTIGRRPLPSRTLRHLAAHRRPSPAG